MKNEINWSKSLDGDGFIHSNDGKDMLYFSQCGDGFEIGLDSFYSTEITSIESLVGLVDYLNSVIDNYKENKEDDA